VSSTYAGEDRKRREEAEVRNTADTLVYSTEKFLAENDDKVPADIKSEVQAAIADLKKAIESNDVDTITWVPPNSGCLESRIGL
jgi:molecular chaperone DnaK